MKNKKKIKIISIDLQKDFSSKGGLCYQPRSSVKFIKNTFIPFLKNNKIKILEIISKMFEIKSDFLKFKVHYFENGEYKVYEDREIKEEIKNNINSELKLR